MFSKEKKSYFLFWRSHTPIDRNVIDRFVDQEADDDEDDSDDDAAVSGEE